MGAMANGEDPGEKGLHCLLNFILFVFHIDFWG